MHSWLTMLRMLWKLLRAVLTKRHAEPAWQWMISGDLQPWREEAAAARQESGKDSQVVNKGTGGTTQ